MTSVIADLPISLIDKNPYQTRFVFDDDMLQELQDSIRQHGVVQPIVVLRGGRAIRPGAGRAAIAGVEAGGERRRFRRLVRRLSQQQAAEMTVLENVVRET